MLGVQTHRARGVTPHSSEHSSDWRSRLGILASFSQARLCRPAQAPSIPVTHELPYDLEVAIAHFVTCYDHSRCHIALSKVTPANVLKGRREHILQQRKDVQLQTIYPGTQR